MAALPVTTAGSRPVSVGVIEAKGLIKTFGDVTVVDGLDLRVERGEFFGILGPNGAGKSTTIRMISSMSPRSGGGLRIFGIDPDVSGPAVRARTGVVFQADLLDSDLTVRENLFVYGRYFGIARAELRRKVPQLLEYAQLSDRADDMVDVLSGGMKRRLAIARSLVNDPDLVLLDEPTTGLDPQARHLLWERLYQLKAQGVTLVLTTHYMDEAEQLCDRLAIMDHGQIIAEGSPADLVRRHSTREVLELRLPGAAPAYLRSRLELLAERVEVVADRWLLYVDDGEAALAATIRLGISPSSTIIRRGALEDVFLRLTGRRLVD